MQKCISNFSLLFCWFCAKKVPFGQSLSTQKYISNFTLLFLVLRKKSSLFFIFCKKMSDTSGHSGQEKYYLGLLGPSWKWPGLGRATQKPWPTGQNSGRVLARPSPTDNGFSYRPIPIPIYWPITIPILYRLYPDSRGVDKWDVNCLLVCYLTLRWFSHPRHTGLKLCRCIDQISNCQFG